MTVTAMPDTAAAGDAAEPKKSKKKLVLILAVVLLVVGGGAYWFVLKPKPAAAAPKPGIVSPLDSIQVNLAGDHYLRIGIALQLTAATKEVDGSEALDATIDEFSGLSITDVADPAKRRDLKKKLEHTLEKRYPDEVMGVYFTEFVTQ